MSRVRRPAPHDLRHADAAMTPVVREDRRADRRDGVSDTDGLTRSAPPPAQPVAATALPGGVRRSDGPLTAGTDQARRNRA